MERSITTFWIFNFICLIAAQTTNYRLPNTVVPSHYEVTINTDIPTFSFDGSVTITIAAQQPTNVITLHSKDLELSNFRITGSPGVSYYNHTQEAETDFLIIRLTNNLVINQNYQLSIDFSGTLGTANVGFYRASYLDENGQTRQLAITHFESTNARRAFPCFDQPDFKATFRLYLIRDSSYNTAANMRLEIPEPYPLDPTKVRDIYLNSVRMPTYLVAFVVSDYGIVSNGTYRVLGRPELLGRGEGEYALNIGRGAIEAMAAFTGVPYSLEKMDQVAVPNEFYRIGAMENWGLVTYRERYLMYNPETSTSSEKQNTATIIAHEFAHQWFGDLVTPEWWQYIWLNEGFATYFEMFIGDQLEPEWKLMEQFITSVVQPAFNADALESAPAMTKEAEAPSEIEAMYSTIVYEKAGSVIRMAAAVLGETAFRAGLTTYLTQWSFNNARPEYLYASWQDAVNNNDLDVAQFLQTWETQPGYPVVNVERNYTSGRASFSQQRFLLNNPDSDATRWIIPYNWFTASSPIPSAYRLTAEDFEEAIDEDGWIIVNHNRQGYYRVNYDEENWRLITEALLENHEQIPVLNRAQLIDDAFNLARSGRLSYSIALALGKYIVAEEEYVPLATFTSVFNYLARMTAKNETLSQYVQGYGQEVLQSIYDKIGFEILPDDGHLDKLLRTNVLTALCNIRHSDCRNESTQAFLSWRSEGASIHPDAQSVVYCNGLRESERPAHWVEMITEYLTTKSDVQRSRLVSALGCDTNPTSLTSLLGLVSAEIILFNQTDRVSLVTSAYSNNDDIGIETVLDYLTTSYEAANKVIGSTATFITNIGSRITTQEQLDLLEAFRVANDELFSDAFRRTIENAKSAAQYNVQWLENVSPQLEDYFLAGDGDGDGDEDGDNPDSASIVASQIFIVLSCIIVTFLH